MKEMLKDFNFNEAPAKMIRKVCGMDLPEDYLEFMSKHNGGEGPIGELGYGCLFRLEELEEINNEYKVKEYWPGYVVIGSDMGGMLWAYNPEEKYYCQIDSVSTDDICFDVSETLKEFLGKIG